MSFLLEPTGVHSSNFLQPHCAMSFFPTSEFTVSASPPSVSAEILQQLLPALSWVCVPRVASVWAKKDCRDTGNLCKSQQQQFSAIFHFGCTFQGLRHRLYFRRQVKTSFEFRTLAESWGREGRRVKNKSRGIEVVEGGLSKCAS